MSRFKIQFVIVYFFVIFMQFMVNEMIYNTRICHF